MKNTTKKVARMLASLLARHGVNEAVVSPGSRNAVLDVFKSIGYEIDI